MNQNILTIQAGGYTAQINLSRGGNCISIRNDEFRANLLREPDYQKGLDNPYLYGMPILFPVNRISDGSFEFEGRKYIFPINEPATGCHLHGTLHETEFELIEQTEDKIVCRYKADSGNPYHGFPHEFEITLCYELRAEGLLQTTSVTNLSETNMPVFLGFHTTFCSLFLEESLPENIFAFVDIEEEFERNMKNYLPTGRRVEFDTNSQKMKEGQFSPFGKPVSRHYRAGGTKMVLYDNGNDVSMVYENDEKLGFRLIYNGQADEYICLEPQNCLANCPNSPIDRMEAGFDFIKPKETKTYESRIFLANGDQR